MGARAMTWRGSLPSLSSPEFPGTRPRTPGTGWGPGYEVPLRRLRQTDDVRGAPAPRRRDARRHLQVSQVRPRRGDADESDGDAARLVTRRRDRGPDGTGAAI